MNNFFRRMLTRDTHHNTSQGENTQNTREVSNNQERPARESAFQTSPWLRRQWDRRTGQMGNAIRRITGNLEPISRNENINTPTENNQIRRWKNKGTPMWDSPSLEQREQKEQKMAKKRGKQEEKEIRRPSAMPTLCRWKVCASSFFFLFFAVWFNSYPFFCLFLGTVENKRNQALEKKSC